MTVHDDHDPRLDALVSELAERHLEMTPTEAIVARGRRRRRRSRVSTAVLGTMTAVVVLLVGLRTGDGSPAAILTAPRATQELLLPDGTRLELTAPEAAPTIGIRYTVSAMPPTDPAVSPPCCAREVRVYDEPALVSADAASPVTVESTTVRADGVEVERASGVEGDGYLRFAFGRWVVVVPVGGGRYPFTMTAAEEELWRQQLDGTASEAGVVLTLPADWTFREAAAPVAQIGATGEPIGILGPETKGLQCQGPVHEAGPWMVYVGGALRLCQPDLPFVLGLSSDTPDESIASIGLSVVSRGPLAGG